MDPKIKEVMKPEGYVRHTHDPMQLHCDEYGMSYDDFKVPGYDHAGGLGKTVVPPPKNGQTK